MGRLRKQYNIRELNELASNVAYKVRLLREKEGISQSELARRSSVSHSTINEFENSIATDIQFSTVCQLAKGLKKKFFDLISASDLELTDPDRKEFLKATDDIEKGFRVLDRLRDRVK